MEYSAVNTIWVLLGAALVFFMQAGFAMMETGFTRAKNAGNIIMKNLMGFCIGMPVFWLFGFGLMFGNAGNGGVIGAMHGVASEANYGAGMCPDGVPFWAFLILQTMFSATAATIVSGAMAERTKFASYCIYSLAISLFVYPISGHWIWGGGWLSRMGFHDFSGSACVHMVGGVAALVGAAVVGPRIGKYHRDGRPRAIPGHNLALGALGVFILWFCWFGFNGASTASMEGEAIVRAGKIFVTTNLSAAFATVTVMLVTWIRYKKPDVTMTLNGSLAGLVAITAGCDTVSPASAALIGILAGIVMVYGMEGIEKGLKVDDPVGVIAVYGLNGALGTICVGLFSDGTGTQWNGLLTGGTAHLLGVQLLGTLSVAAWVAVAMTLVFEAIKHTMGLRVSEEAEVSGLDATEHNLANAYSDFMYSPERTVFLGNYASGKKTGKVPLAEAVSVEYQKVVPAGDTQPKISKITILCKQNKFDELKLALNHIGVSGITVTQVLGCGVQKGATKMYRGTEVDIVLLPKVKVEVVVSAVPVDAVIRAAKRALYTGNIGDGKIFVYTVDNVIKVRTGEEGYAALQGEN